MSSRRRRRRRRRRHGTPSPASRDLDLDLDLDRRPTTDVDRRDLRSRVAVCPSPLVRIHSRRLASAAPRRRWASTDRRAVLLFL